MARTSSDVFPNPFRKPEELKAGRCRHHGVPFRAGNVCPVCRARTIREMKEMNAIIAVAERQNIDYAELREER